MAGTLQNRRWANALIDSGEVKVYQYGTQDPLIAGWTIGSTVRSAFVRLPPGEYIQRDWQGLETIITVSAQGFDWKVGPLPRYLLPRRPRAYGHGSCTVRPATSGRGIEKAQPRRREARGTSRQIWVHEALKLVRFRTERLNREGYHALFCLRDRPRPAVPAREPETIRRPPATKGGRG